MKTTISKTKNTLKEIYSQLHETEYWISNFEDKVEKNSNQNNQKKKF